ncbi:hypothetical protein [Miltoncostaea oceani]|uniref:hypothetical protein n=1 Tax=Miltoncostaea oceani TaxID=2843216 RepID=UPI001C3E6955|nr:hypothetical protein [Miltoncostaea oceani]
MKSHRLMLAAFACCALAGSVVVAPSEAQAARSCASFVVAGPDWRYTVKATVEVGNATCQTARGLFTDLYLGRGTTSGEGPSRVTLVRGWRCGTGAGGAACFRGTSIDAATQRITAEVNNAPPRARQPVQRRCANVIVRNPDGSVYARSRNGVFAVRTTCPVARRVAFAVLNADDGDNPLPRPEGFRCRLVGQSSQLGVLCSKGRQSVRWTFGRA